MLRPFEINISGESGSLGIERGEPRTVGPQALTLTLLIFEDAMYLAEYFTTEWIVSAGPSIEAVDWKMALFAILFRDRISPHFVGLRTLRRRT